jgi:sortase A
MPGTVDDMAATDTPSGRTFTWRTPVRWFGLLCLMGSAFFAGYVVWLLWGTGLETSRAQDELRAGLEQAIDHPVAAPPSGTRPPLGSAYAAIVIPRIDLDFIVVEGTDYESLKKGAGHYPDTADPWDATGRVGIAGHRTTYLAPFFDLEDVIAGDRISLLTEYGTFDYEVTRNYVIPSTGSGVVLRQTDQPTLVLTTCNPKYSSSERLIVEARQVGAAAA